ncbi:MAG: hypothetical protein JNK23_10650 [Opitutaceae bacterium]|nr:hypothetical protein [Opitutaceae bacterium]
MKFRILLLLLLGCALHSSQSEAWAASAPKTFADLTSRAPAGTDYLVGYRPPMGTGSDTRFLLSDLNTYFSANVTGITSSQIASLGWAKLTGTPTTLAGYNIGDSLTAAALNGYFGDPSTNPSFSASAWKNDLALDQVNNTTDASKPVSSATQAALDLKASLAALIATNGAGINNGGKVHWTQLMGVPAGFADGTDDGAGGGSGTVTSVSSGNLSPLFSVSVATATSTPAFTFSLTNAAQNAFFAGPASGGAGAPGYRAIVPADIPSLTLSKISDAGDAAGKNTGTGSGQVAAGDHTHGNASTGAAGFMSASDKTKLDGIAAGAQVNRALASQAEAEAGTDNTKDMTPLRVAQAIAALAPGGGGGGTVTSSGPPTAGQVAVFSSGTNIVGGNTTGTGDHVRSIDPVLRWPSEDMGASTAIAVNKMRQTKSLAADTTFTFAATPDAGGRFGVEFTNTDSASHTVTIPSSFSFGLGGTRTSFVLRAGDRVWVTWLYDGTGYSMHGDPVRISELATSTPAGDSQVMLSVAGEHGKATVAAIVATQIGTAVQAHDADLDIWAGVTPGANVAGAAAIAADAAGGFTRKEYVDAAVDAKVDNTAYSSAGNGVAAISWSKNALYDYLHLFDTDDDGKVNVLDNISAAGLAITDSSGAVTGTRTITGTSGNITVTNGDGAGGNPTINIGANVVTKATNLQSIRLTIDNIADGQGYSTTHIPAAFTVTRVVIVHEGAGLSSPSIVCTLKHDTDRSATGTTIEAITATSSTTGTNTTTGFDDPTIPADSWLWVNLSGKSGTTANLHITIYGTYD